jgi:hypothetical protein
MSVRDPVVSDVSVSAVTEVARGQQVTITAEIANAQRMDQSYTYVVEIFAPSGQVESIMLDSGELERGETSTISTTWDTGDLQATGTFEIKVILLSSLEQPQILATVGSTQMEVLAQ